MNFDKNVANGDLNALFDCRGNELTPNEDGGINDGCPLAMVYGISQQFRNINDPVTGLARGTIFAELDKPFLGYKCNKGGCSL